MVERTDRARDAAADRYLRVFDALRARLDRRGIAEVRHAEHREHRRKHATPGARYQRGDDASPPPILELALDDPRDKEGVIQRLTHRCGTQPVWRLGEAKEASRQVPRDRDTRPWSQRIRRGREVAVGEPWSEWAPDPTEGLRRPGGVTTDDLYARLGRLVDDLTTAHPPPETFRWRQPAPVTPLRRLRSLLALRDVDVPEAARRISGREDRREDDRLQFERRAEVHVIEHLRAGRSGSRGAGSGERGLRPRDVYYAALDRATSGIAGLSRVATLGRLDEKVLSPLQIYVTAALTVAPITLGVALTTINEIVTATVALGLLGVYGGLGMFLFVPWWTYLWLKHHRYTLGGRRDRSAETKNHRQLGIEFINALHETATEAGSDVLGVHRLGANALLDDLESAYGTARWEHRWLPRRKRRYRPVLIADRERLTATERYLLGLIEHVRLRRRFPDPLLVVVVGTRDSGRATAESAGRVARRGVADSVARVRRFVQRRRAGDPAGESDPASVVQDWRHTRHGMGRLGDPRVLECRVPRGGGEGQRDTGASADRVLTPFALAMLWTGAAAGVALLVFAVNWIGPGVAQTLRPCVQGDDFAPPGGIASVSGECVGLTDGSFSFHPRLTRAENKIAELNRKVRSSGRPYVTVVYMGALTVENMDQQSNELAGVHGELAGLALRQQQYNTVEADSGDDQPLVRVLLANTGSRWQHGQRVAGMVARQSEDHDTPRGDRIRAAVGFGQSLDGTNDAITRLTRAGLPMVGTTTTFDDIARTENGRTSKYFFPLAAPNTRLAKQAAYWANSGAGPADAEGNGDLAPAGTAVALGDDSAQESYGVDLATTFMAEFTRLGGRPAAGGLGGQRADTGVVPFGGDQPALDEIIPRICAEDPPELIYFGGRSDSFGGFHDELKKQGECRQQGVRVVGSDDIAKYVTDHVADLEKSSGKLPVYYTPLAASGAHGAARDEHDFYAEFDEQSRRDFGLDDQETDLWPSTAHGAMAYDALIVAGEAVKQARRDQYGSSPDWESPTGLVEQVRTTDDLSGVSGLLEFGEGTGQWPDDKLIQLVQAGPGGTQRRVASCGRLTEDVRSEDLQAHTTNCHP